MSHNTAKQSFDPHVSIVVIVCYVCAAFSTSCQVFLIKKFKDQFILDG